MRRIVLSLCLLLCFLSSKAEEHNGPWSLQDCINYALEHNISVQQQSLASQRAELDLQTAKYDRLPSLSGSASQNYSFGRGLSADNTYVNTNTASTGFSLGAGINLFSGFRVEETIKLRQLDLQSANAALLKAQNDISMNVAQAFMQILYNTEIVAVAQRQIRIDSMQVERISHLLLSGKASQVEVSAGKATLQQSRYTLIQAQNQLKLSVLSLTQLLELPSPEGFTIVPPQTDTIVDLIENPESIFEYASQNRPEILAERIKLDSYSSQLKIAKSALYPSLSLNAGLGTNYYDTQGLPKQSFAQQMKNNFSQYVGLSLNIPIFNKFATRNNIRSTELLRTAQSLNMQNVTNSLYKEIQQAYYAAIAAQSRYLSASRATTAAEESFVLVQAKYEGGKASITEFNESKNAALKAQSDLLQAKYEYLYQSKLLDFYKGIEF